jgi:hypothetical protein
MRRRRASIAPSLFSIADLEEEEEEEDREGTNYEEEEEVADKWTRPPETKERGGGGGGPPPPPPPPAPPLLPPHSRLREKGHTAGVHHTTRRTHHPATTAGYERMTLPPGWRVLPSNSPQEFGCMEHDIMRTVVLLRYENVYSGERFSMCPTAAADAEMPSRVFHVVSKYGENLIAEQDARASNLIQCARELNARFARKSGSLKDYHLGKESSRIVRMALSQDRTPSQYGVSSLYSTALHTEIRKFQPQAANIAKEAMAKIQLMFSKQIEQLQKSVSELSQKWHEGDSVKTLILFWHTKEGMMARKQHTLSDEHYAGILQGNGNAVRRKRTRRPTIHHAHAPNPAQSMSNIGRSAHEIDSKTTDGAALSSTMVRIPEPTQAALAALSVETAQQRLMKEEQLHLMYGLQRQTQLLHRVQAEIKDIHLLVKLSKQRRSDDSLSDAKNKNASLGIYALHTSSRKFGKSVHEHHRHIVEEDIEEARTVLHEVDSDLQSSHEMIGNCRSRTGRIRKAFRQWDRKAASISRNAYLGPVIRHGFGYDVDHTKKMAATVTRGTEQHQNRFMSRLFTVAHRSQQATNKRAIRLEQRQLQMLRGKAETNYQQAKESSSTHQQNGHRRVNKRLLLLRELSVSLKSGIGSIGASRTSVQEPNAHNVQSDRTAAKHRAPKQASPLVSDPRFQQLHLARYKAMTGCLQRYGASKLVVMEISFALVSHEENIVALLNPSRLKHRVSALPNPQSLVKILEPLHKEFHDELRHIISQQPDGYVSPGMLAELVKIDTSILKLRMPSTLANMIRVLNVLHRFDVKKSPTAKDFIAIEKAALEDSESDEESNPSSQVPGALSMNALRAQQKDPSKAKDDFDSLSDWDHDHRLSRINTNNLASIRDIAKTHQLERRTTSALERKVQDYFRITDKLVLQKDHMDLSEFHKEMGMACAAHDEQLEELAKQHNLGGEVLQQLKSASMQHHIHIVHGDGVESGDDESEGD